MHSRSHKMRSFQPQVALETDASCFYFWSQWRGWGASLYGTKTLSVTGRNKQISGQDRAGQVWGIAACPQPSFALPGENQFHHIQGLWKSVPPNSPDTWLELQRQIVDNEIWVEAGGRLVPQASLSRRLICDPVNADGSLNVQSWREGKSRSLRVPVFPLMSRYLSFPRSPRRAEGWYIKEPRAHWQL